ncbi:hypothetical protein CZP2022_25 [Vibrio phage C-ZP2022]|nr:hypothetical protein CZP2022_25 [Vibrio phage C-ZP2022]
MSFAEITNNVWIWAAFLLGFVVGTLIIGFLSKRQLDHKDALLSTAKSQLTQSRELRDDAIAAHRIYEGKIEHVFCNANWHDMCKFIHESKFTQNAISIVTKDPLVLGDYQPFVLRVPAAVHKDQLFGREKPGHIPFADKSGRYLGLAYSFCAVRTEEFTFIVGFVDSNGRNDLERKLLNLSVDFALVAHKSEKDFLQFVRGPGRKLEGPVLSRVNDLVVKHYPFTTRLSHTLDRFIELENGPQ